MFSQFGQVDGYYISNDSDDDGFRASDSSEDEKQLDEVDVFLHGTPDQQRRAFQRLTGDEASSSEDEFEKAMKEELDQKMAIHKRSWMNDQNATDNASTSKESTSKCIESENYDDVYFDSDEDDQDKRMKAKKKKMSNDELFYDPFADDQNQKWADKQKLRGSAKFKQRKTKAAPTFTNDTTLTCPACMTTLCMDCQRHDIYPNQYRAMFVMNCAVKTDELLHYKEPKKKKFKRHKRRESQARPTNEAGFTTASAGETEFTYNPVKCETCDTEVAVYDKDEVYHFFNVIAGPG